MSDLYYEAQDLFDDDVDDIESHDSAASAVPRLMPIAAWRRLEQLREDRQLRERLREFYDD